MTDKQKSREKIKELHTLVSELVELGTSHEQIVGVLRSCDVKFKGGKMPSPARYEFFVWSSAIGVNNGSLTDSMEYLIDRGQEGWQVASTHESSNRCTYFVMQREIS